MGIVRKAKHYQGHFQAQWFGTDTTECKQENGK